MKITGKKSIAFILIIAVFLGITGCGKNKKEPKPTPKATKEAGAGDTTASGKGSGQTDAPLVVACNRFSKHFNPFTAQTEADKQAVALTQVELVSKDRAGRIIYHGIDGEYRSYHQTFFTYYGVSNMVIDYDAEANETQYRITIRDDMLFSDGEKLTIDDVIFTMYVLCDTSYHGENALRNMPVKGLLNYRADSSKAEELSEKQLQHLLKKHKKEFEKWLRQSDVFGADDTKHTISREEQLKAARFYFGPKTKGSKKVSSIAGIEKNSDYEMTITTEGYKKEMSAALCFPICALHYYGDVSKYQPEEGSYGFIKGDVSSVLANESTPMGAGAYRYVKYEADVVYYTSNELYYKGCPSIAFLQLKDMTKILQETKKEISKKQIEEAERPVPEDDSQTPEPTVNPSGELLELTQGTVDIISGSFFGEQLDWISGTNESEEYSGSKVNTQFVADGDYHYAGLHAGNLAVDGEKNSEKSLALRKAIATVIAAAKYVLKEETGEAVTMLNYPVASESWVSPKRSGEMYELAFAKGADGKTLYRTSDSVEAKMGKAKKAALAYLECAGYTVAANKIQPKQGQKTALTLAVVSTAFKEGTAFVQNIKQLMEEIGFTVTERKDITEISALKQALAAGEVDIWLGSRRVEDMDLLERYGTGAEGNLSALQSVTVEEHIQKLQSYLTIAERKEAYFAFFRALLGEAVEVPVCEFNTAVFFSAGRIKKDTIPLNLSPYYSWTNVVHKIERE